MEKVNVDVLDRMSDLVMELDAVRTIMWYMVREGTELEAVQRENVLYFVSETMDRIYDNSGKIMEEVDYFLMNQKKN